MALGGQHKRAVGVFSSRQDAEHALNELNRSGFSMDKVSIIARDSSRQDDIAGVGVSDQVGNKADEGAAAGAITGGTLGGITGLLVGIGSLAIPGVGPILVAGEIATVLGTTLAGGAIGAAAGGLVGALVGLGIPEERARVYNDRVERGGYLVIVNGSDQEIARAEAILHNRGIEEWGIYNSPAVDPTYAAAPMGGVTGMPIDPTYAATPFMGGMTGAPVGYNPVANPMPADYATTSRAVERNQRAVGVFSTRRDVEHALNELRDSGFPMDKVSVVTKDADRGDEIAGAGVSDRVGNKADEGATTGAITGGALGGLGGLLVGLGAVAIPGIGPIMLAGATATTIATTLAGGAIGAAAGGLVGALIGLGIPEERARVYNDRVSRGDYLVFVDGTEAEIRRAEAILSNRGIQEWGVYDAPDTDTSRSEYVATETSSADYTTTGTDPNVIVIDRRDETR
jgi:hypothetical protein